MAHYAYLDESNIVVDVIVGLDEDEIVDGISDWEEYYGSLRNQVCKRTSYNTYSGEHFNNGVPFRKNYANIGDTYDSERDAFIPPKPFESWSLNELTCQWDPPAPYPTFNPDDDTIYFWDEVTLEWTSLEHLNYEVE